MALTGISGVDNRVSETFILCYEGIVEKRGNFSISDSVNIQLAMDRKYRKKRITTERNMNKMLEDILANIKEMKGK